MGSIYRAGKNEGSWVLCQGVKYWLSYITPEQFRRFKKRGMDNLDFRIEKDGQSRPAKLSQLELAE